MRKIVVAEFASLDGVVEAPERWHFPYADQELFQAMFAVNESADTMLFGRVTYEAFAGAFAHAPADDPVAGRLTGTDKVVVSSTLGEPGWARTTVLGGDVVAGVRALKEGPGRDVVVTGSLQLVRTLLGAGLVDELRLFVHPIVVGDGERLLAPGAAPVPLRLTGSTVLGSGVVDAAYTTV